MGESLIKGRGAFAPLPFFNLKLLKENIVARNKPYGDNKRVGAVKGRSQTHNPKTDKWVKRDTETGRFMDQKADDSPFKGVRKEK